MTKFEFMKMTNVEKVEQIEEMLWLEFNDVREQFENGERSAESLTIARTQWCTASDILNLLRNADSGLDYLFEEEY